MGSLNSKTRPDGPASENQSAEDGRTSEIDGTQPPSATPSDVSQKTPQVYCVEDSTRDPTKVYCVEDSIQQPIKVYCVEDDKQQPTQEGDEGHISVPSEDMEQQGLRKASQGDSETPSLAKTSGASEVVCGTLEEGELDPKLIELIEKFMAEHDSSSTRTDILCVPCPECLVGDDAGHSSESSTSPLGYDLCFPLMSEQGPRISKELSKPLKVFKETRPDVPVAKTAGLATQQGSPGSVHVSDVVTQMKPAGKDAEVDSRMTEKEAAEICVSSSVPETQEKGANRTVDGEIRECNLSPITQSSSSASWENLDVPTSNRG